MIASIIAYVFNLLRARRESPCPGLSFTCGDFEAKRCSDFYLKMHKGSRSMGNSKERMKLKLHYLKVGYSICRDFNKEVVGTLLLVWVFLYIVIPLSGYSRYGLYGVVEILSSWRVIIDYFIISVSVMYYGRMWKRVSREVEEIGRDMRSL